MKKTKLSCGGTGIIQAETCYARLDVHGNLFDMPLKLRAELFKLIDDFRNLQVQFAEEQVENPEIELFENDDA